MTKLWKPGEVVLLRGIYNQRPWIVQSTLVVKDSEEEIALALLPGAECILPEGYIHERQRPEWNRWEDHRNDTYHMGRYIWHTNRLLILLEPNKYYATIYFWEDQSNRFLCYYINFQLPFVRATTGFDTLDLELDIVIERTYAWRWKDLEDYQDGIARGVLVKQWTDEVEMAKKEVIKKIELRQYPLDGTWLNWRPDPNWHPPRLPENWDEVEFTGLEIE